MKKFFYSLAVIALFGLAGCFETTQETSINKDGSGLFTNTIDLSSMLDMLKQMGGDDAQKMQNVDTSIALSGIVDSIEGFDAHQKQLISKGTMSLTLNMADEKLLVKLKLPFQKTSDITMLQQVLPKISEAAMKKMPGTGQMPAGMDSGDSSKIKSLDDFYTVNYSDKLITKTLIKDKYDAEKDGDFMKSLQQMTDMGSPITANYIVHLPRAAKKVEGKAAKLSDDKKTVTIKATSEDFFSDPSKFEYRIEY